MKKALTKCHLKLTHALTTIAMSHFWKLHVITMWKIRNTRGRLAKCRHRHTSSNLLKECFQYRINRKEERKKSKILCLTCSMKRGRNRIFYNFHGGKLIFCCQLTRNNNRWQFLMNFFPLCTYNYLVPMTL